MLSFAGQNKVNVRDNNHALVLNLKVEEKKRILRQREGVFFFTASSNPLGEVVKVLKIQIILAIIKPFYISSSLTHENWMVYNGAGD